MKKYLTSKKIICVFILLISMVAIFVIVLREKNEVLEPILFKSEKMEISFSYPKKYFVKIVDVGNGERSQYSIVLLEDTPVNREIIEGKISGTEIPPSINIGVFQNNLDNFSAENFIRNISYSNFKLSDGSVSESEIGGHKALRYEASGLYENFNEVVARENFVYMFTVFFNSKDDEIISDFDRILETVKFESSS